MPEPRQNLPFVLKVAMLEERAIKGSNGLAMRVANTVKQMIACAEGYGKGSDAANAVLMVIENLHDKGKIDALTHTYLKLSFDVAFMGQTVERQKSSSL